MHPGAKQLCLPPQGISWLQCTVSLAWFIVLMQSDFSPLKSDALLVAAGCCWWPPCCSYPRWMWFWDISWITLNWTVLSVEVVTATMPFIILCRLLLANHCQSALKTIELQAEEFFSDIDSGSLASRHNSCQISTECIEIKLGFCFFPPQSLSNPVIFVMPVKMYVLGWVSRE